ncbi:MAG: helix-turn-helix domain-containing protein [Dethiosulfatibacter sp.]|nr:helix-turn-helix domain-containing protein [Dethiosulfatibacter sp.]
MKLDDLDDILTVAEVAEFLKLSRPTIYAAITQKKLKPLKVGRVIRIYKTDLKLYIEDLYNSY